MTDLVKNVELLRQAANARSISIADELHELPEGDLVAEIGLLSDKLDIPLHLALSDQLTADDLAS